MNTQTINEYRDLPIALLTESKTNPRRTFEENSLKELADYVPGHIIGQLVQLGLIEGAAGVGGGLVDLVDGEELEATGHHPNAGEDETAETDDSARVHGERLERSHERLSAGEVHRSLGVRDDWKEHEGEGNQSRRLETLNGSVDATTPDFGHELR